MLPLSTATCILIDIATEGATSRVFYNARISKTSTGVWNDAGLVADVQMRVL